MKTTSILSVFLSAAVALGNLVIPAANVYAESEEKRIEIDTDNVTGGEGYKGSSYLNAVDGDLGTFFDGLTGQYVQIDMGSTYDISSVKYRAGEDWATERMVGCYFEGSLNGVVWERIYTVTEEPEWGNGEMIEIGKDMFETENTVFRYVRIQAPPEQFCNIAEIELYGEYAEAEEDPVISDEGFRDSFEDSGNWIGVLGEWTVTEGYDGNKVFSQTAADTGSSSTRNEMRAVIDGRTWSDAVYEFDVRYDGSSFNDDMSNWVGVSFRKADEYTSWRDPSGYMLYWRIDGRMELGKGNAADMVEKSAEETGGAHSPDAKTAGEWRHLRIVNAGSNIKVFTDNSDQPLFDITDESGHAQSGYFTLNTSASAWSFDNVGVYVDGDLIEGSGYYDLTAGAGVGGVISVPVVLFEKSVERIELLDKDGGVIKELKADTDYTSEAGLDSTVTYTFDNAAFSGLTSGETYTISFTYSDGTASGYELYAEEGLEAADKTALIEAIAEASGYIEIDYTPESWDALERALETALTVRDTQFAGQADVDAAAQALSDAIDGLVKRDDVIYKEGLMQAIDKADELADGDYTELSLERLSEALAEAKDAAASDESSQEEINNALRDLTIAMQNLSAEPVVPDGEYTEITDMKTNDLTDPFGIDDPAPAFSWNMRSNIVGQKQTAYEITVSKNSDMTDPIWDSGKVESGVSAGIVYEGPGFSDSTTYYWQIRVWDKDGSELVSDTAEFTTALMSEDAWDKSSFISVGEAAPEKGGGVPIFRKEFSAQKQIKSAVLYSTALGNYDVYINGERVGELMEDGTTVYDELKPGYTDMGLRVQYQSYDVTHLLNSDGLNTVSAVVANGWWNNAVNGSVWGGTEQTRSFRAQLCIVYGDGSSEIIPTDTSWKASYGGPVMYGDIFNGEYYDANADDSWKENGYDDSGWGQAAVYEHDPELAAQRGQRLTVRDELDLSAVSATVYEGAVGADNQQYGVINTRAVYSGSEPFELKKGQTAVIDFGQNFAGWAEIDAEGAKGTQITLKYGEMLNDENGLRSRGNDGPEGSVYLANLRGAEATDIYTMSGEGIESYHPSYTYHGFRYLSVTASEDITIHNAAGKVLTSVENVTGKLYTSNALVNRLYSNSLWGQYSNYVSIPSDCPQRDERQGWGADTWVFSITGAYNADTYGFMSKWMQDMQNAQQRQNGDSEGDYGVTAPYWFGARWRSVGWADAAVIVPYNMYKMYGDSSIIEENYESMQKYVDVYLYKSHPVGRGNERDYGDWLYDELNTTELKQYLGTAFMAWDYLMMADMAEILGKDDDAAKYRGWYDEVKEYFNETYVDEDGNLIIPGQDSSIGIQPTAYLYALKVGLLPDEASVQKNLDALVERIEGNDNKLETGFLGTAVLLQTLTDLGRGDVAYKLLLQRGYPSWLFTVDQGATTFWERWNSYSLENGFGDVSMNSFNHYSFGVVAEWMYSYMAGIMPDMAQPGFKHTILQPLTDSSGEITFTDSSYDSAYGLIESNWEVNGSETSYSFTVPANTTATLYLPAAEQAESWLVIESAAAEGVEYAGTEMHNGAEAARFELQPGGYDITVTDSSVSVTLKDGYITSGDVYGLYQGEECLSHIPSDGDVTFRVDLAGTGESSADLIYALYDRDSGELISAGTERIGAEQVTEVPIPLPEQRSDIILKVFLWDMDTLRSILPVCEYTAMQ